MRIEKWICLMLAGVGMAFSEEVNEYLTAPDKAYAYRYDPDLKMLVVKSAAGTAASFYEVPQSLVDDMAREPDTFRILKEKLVGKYKVKHGDHLPTAADLEKVSFSELITDSVEKTDEEIEKVEGAGKVFGKGNAAVLGNRSWYINAGALVSQADVEGLETDTGFTLSTGWNIPVSQHVDFNVGFGYSQQSGTVEFIEEVPYTVYDRRYYYTYFYRYTYLVPRTAYRSVLVEEEFDVSTFAGLGALTLHAAPGQPVNPFLVGGVYYVNQEVEVGYISASESDTGFSVGGGVEFIMGDQVSFIPSVVHSKAGDAEETSINALLTYWYAMPSAVRFSGAYGTESENILISLGYMYMY